MRSPIPVFLSLLLFSLLSGCHKTGSKGTGLAGEWRATSFYAGPAAEVVWLDNDHVWLMRLSPDSTFQQTYTGRLLSSGKWSVQPIGAPAGSVYTLTFTDSLGANSFAYQALLSQDTLTLTTAAITDYVAKYIRN